MKTTSWQGLALVALLGWGGPVAGNDLLDDIGAAAKGAGDAVLDTSKKIGQAVDDAAHDADDLFSNEATPEETRAKLDAMTDETLAHLFEDVPASQPLFEHSAGYAVFDTRKLTVFPVTAGAGRGVAVDRVTEGRTYMQMATGGLGASLGIGGFETQVVMLFETEALLQDFVRDGYDAAAEAEAKFDDDTTHEALRFDNGRKVFVLGTRGWRVAASIGGSKFWPDRKLN